MPVTGTYDLVGLTMCAAMQHRCRECDQWHFGHDKPKRGAA